MVEGKYSAKLCDVFAQMSEGPHYDHRVDVLGSVPFHAEVRAWIAERNYVWTVTPMLYFMDHPLRRVTYEFEDPAAAFEFKMRFAQPVR